MGNTTSWLAQSLCPEEQTLWVAAKNGDLVTLRERLARLTPETRFYAEWQDSVYGYSPLSNACWQGHLHCVQALVAYGVNCNVRDSQGKTPLHIATSCGKSEVVRLLLESSARDEEPSLIQCAEHIEKKLCLYSGWLYERSDNFLSIASGISGLESWKKRYALVLRTAASDVVEIDLFPMKPGERRPPVPSLELLYKTSDGIQQSDNATWLNRKEYRLSLKVSRKLGSNRASAIQSMDFAATNQEELTAWKTFLTTLRVNAPATIARGANSCQRAQSSQPGASCAQGNQDAVLQEQRDLERALQLSLQEARHHSRTHTAPSAPPPSDTMLETLGYSETVVGPDGVEIVQLLRDDDTAVAHDASSRSPASALLGKTGITGLTAEAQRSDECVICFDGPQEAVCVPCGHNAVCMNCAQELLDTTGLCPVCRQQVREAIRLYRV
ncbi:unnamed protein product [Peronospora destructor]|uniref:RING-type domain-containing protein n=1 Tax=Peronospora destructor TaxID=86335 RepID=A0AAV0U7R3_9STRA|nr:unnamed protein product [Peronospora destructor]